MGSCFLGFDMIAKFSWYKRPKHFPSRHWTREDMVDDQDIWTFAAPFLWERLHLRNFWSSLGSERFDKWRSFWCRPLRETHWSVSTLLAASQLCRKITLQYFTETQTFKFMTSFIPKNSLYSEHLKVQFERFHFFFSSKNPGKKNVHKTRELWHLSPSWECQFSFCCRVSCVKSMATQSCLQPYSPESLKQLCQLSNKNTTSKEQFWLGWQQKERKRREDEKKFSLRQEGRASKTLKIPGTFCFRWYIESGISFKTSKFKFVLVLWISNYKDATSVILAEWYENWKHPTK